MAMYVIKLTSGGFIQSAVIQRALADLPLECGSELHKRRMQQLGVIEHLEARGMAYANQDFDVLSSALNFVDAVAPDVANELRDSAGALVPAAERLTGQRCLLNDKPATIAGRMNRFATVLEIDGPLAVEFI